MYDNTIRIMIVPVELVFLFEYGSFTTRTHDCSNLVNAAHVRFSRSGSRGLRLRQISSAGAQIHNIKSTTSTDVLCSVCVCVCNTTCSTTINTNVHQQESCSTVVSIIIIRNYRHARMLLWLQFIP